MKYRGECEVALEKAVLGNLNTIAEVGPREKSRNHKTLYSANLTQTRINVLRVQRKVSSINKIYKLRG